jgi:nitrogen regulatory protein PII
VHNKIEIIVHNDEVDKVIKTILDLSQTGERGDGVLIVQKIEELIKIRTGEKVGPYDL